MSTTNQILTEKAESIQKELTQIQERFNLYREEILTSIRQALRDANVFDQVESLENDLKDVQEKAQVRVDKLVKDLESINLTLDILKQDDSGLSEPDDVITKDIPPVMAPVQKKGSVKPKF